MYTTLDPETISLLCCPLCKGFLTPLAESFVCKDCATQYPTHRFSQGKAEEKVFDFRIHRPTYAMSSSFAAWARVQQGWEACYVERYRKLDDLKQNLGEIDSVSQIYNKEFDIKGKILDVGGCEGKLRHFLQKDNVTLYVSVDPLIDVFQDFEARINLLKAYPSLAKPCNFAGCLAENLPFAAHSFDWVHMRSVLDHFQDPYLALKEAWRVLKPGGSLMIGLTVYGGNSSLKAEDQDFALRHIVAKAFTKLKTGGIKNFVQAMANKITRKRGWETDHTFYWKYPDLLNLLRDTQFSVVKEYWQKPPLDMCVYLEAKKS